MGVAEVRRPKILEEENRILRQLVAEPAPADAAGCAQKKALRPAQLRTRGRVSAYSLRLKKGGAVGEGSAALSWLLYPQAME